MKRIAKLTVPRRYSPLQTHQVSARGAKTSSRIFLAVGNLLDVNTCTPLTPLVMGFGSRVGWYCPFSVGLQLHFRSTRLRLLRLDSNIPHNTLCFSLLSVLLHTAYPFHNLSSLQHYQVSAFNMSSFSSLIILLGVFASFTFSIALSQDTPEAATSDRACTHGPDKRACWREGYSVATDFDKKFPVTGNTVLYDLKLTNGTCNPDGHGDRVCLLVNGQYPGPLIRATWGDMVQVTVANAMQDNGTSIHFHGLRQYLTNAEDGVNGVTECPLAPGDTRTYTFEATQ